MSLLLENKKLLLIGPSKGSVHLNTYYNLIKNYFKDILVVTEGEIDYATYKQVDFSIRNPIRAKKNIKRIRKIIQEFQPDIIHAHQANSCSYMAVKANKNRIPLIVTAWGSDVLVLPERSKILKKMVQQVLKNALIVTADAQYMIDVIEKLNPGTKTALVNFGIELNTISNEKKQNLIYSNRLHKDLYNIDKIIEAFQKFHLANSEWKLLIGAKGPKMQQLKSQAKENLPENSFEFIGFVDQEENRKRYYQSKIWISIPDSDGTAISLLEAMGYGCVPVVADLPANNEWIRDGENGIIVKEDVVEALERAINLDQSKVASMNLELIAKKGTKEVNREIFLSIYKSIGAQ